MITSDRIKSKESLKDFVFESINAVFLNRDFIKLCLENKLHPVSERVVDVIGKIAHQHFSQFKILAEREKYSDVKLLHTSIFALVIEVLGQRNYTNDSINKKKSFEDLKNYIESKLLKK